MCHTLESSPPIKPIAGGAADSRDLTLASEDGTQFAAFFAAAAKPTGAGMVVLPDVRGLYRFYEELALRFAEAGINSVALDYFGRTAGVGKRDDAFPFMEHVMKTKQPQIAADTAAAVAYLRSPEGGACTTVFTVGFCFGGSNSWMQSTAGHGLGGAIGFYGRPGDGRDGSPGAAARAGDFACPILALMGGADQGIPQDQVDAFGAAMKSAGVQHEIVVYPGAPHSFFDRLYEQHADAASDAWSRVLKFVETNSAKQ